MELGIEADAFINDTLKPATLQLPFNSEQAPSPQTGGKAAAGTVVLVEGEPALIVDRIHAPVLGIVDGVVEVTGESMEPTFKSGCRIGIVRLTDRYALKWGDCYYIVDINKIGYVRRIHRGSAAESLLLVSDYPDQSKYPSFERRWDQIHGIFAITASILRL